MVIDKKWFYWLEVIEKLGWLVWWIKAILLVSLCLYGLSIMLAYIEYNVWDEWEENKGKLLKGFKIPVIAFILVLIISIFLPTKQTLVQMKVAEQITYENIDYSIEAIKDAVDYIFEKVGK